MRIHKLISVVVAAAFIVACSAPLQQNIQAGNKTGNTMDNKWDYFNGMPIPYTSFQRTVVKNNIISINENTDSFQIILNASINGGTASLVMNGIIIELKRKSGTQYLDKLFEKTKVSWDGKRSALDVFDAFYESSNGDYVIAIRHKEQILVTLYMEASLQQSLAYYPSRFLACRKIAIIKNQTDAAMIAALLKTALVAGVQSYTSYSTGTYTGSYGNFGYIQVRDYSWAGARAGDALTTLFNGSASAESINNAWNSLNCW